MLLLLLMMTMLLLTDVVDVVVVNGDVVDDVSLRLFVVDENVD